MLLPNGLLLAYSLQEICHFLNSNNQLRVHFPDQQPITSVQLNNTVGFTSKLFDDYCSSVRIEVEHLVPRVHTLNRLAGSFIKWLQLIARPLLMKAKLPISVWGHATLYALMLIKLRPTSYHSLSPVQLVT